MPKAAPWGSEVHPEPSEHPRAKREGFLREGRTRHLSLTADAAVE
jgi:hypothetical protein